MTYPWEGAIPADDLERFRASGTATRSARSRPANARA